MPLRTGRPRSLFLPTTSSNLETETYEAPKASRPQSLRRRISVSSLCSWTKRKAKGISVISEPSPETLPQTQLNPPPVVHEGAVELDGYAIPFSQKLEVQAEPVELPAEVPDDELPLSVLREVMQRQIEDEKQQPYLPCDNSQEDNSNHRNSYEPTDDLPGSQLETTSVETMRMPQRYRRNAVAISPSWKLSEHDPTLLQMPFQELSLSPTHRRRSSSLSGAASCRSSPAILSTNSRIQGSSNSQYNPGASFCHACGQPLHTILERDSEDEDQQTARLSKPPIHYSARREMHVRATALNDRDLMTAAFVREAAARHRPRSSSTSSYSSASVAGSSQRGSPSSWCGPAHHSRDSLSTQCTAPSWRTRSSSGPRACGCRGETCAEPCPRCRPLRALHLARKGGCGAGSARRDPEPPVFGPGPSPGQVVPRFFGPQTQDGRWVPLLAQREEWLSWIRMGHGPGMNYGIAGEPFAARTLSREAT